MLRNVGLAVVASLLSACVPLTPEVQPADSVVQTPMEDRVVRGGSQTGSRYPQRTLHGSGDLQIRAYLQDVMTDRMGASTWNAFNDAPTGIAVASLPGRWAASQEPTVNLLIKRRTGWSGRAGGSEAPVSQEVARELDHLLESAELWAEISSSSTICPDAGADVAVIRRSRRTATIYGGCGTGHLTRRLIATALRERLAN